MSLEDDVFNAFKYVGLGSKIDPTQMVRILLRNLEVSMLSQMEMRIKARLGELQHESKPSDNAMDPFSILGVDASATREEVDKAYRERAREVHPDKGGNDIEMAKINAAYETIRIFKGWKER